MNILFHSKEKAQKYLDDLKDIICKYGYVSVADAKDLVDYPIRHYSDISYGWANINYVMIRPYDAKGYFTVRLDRPIPIKSLKYEHSTEPVLKVLEKTVSDYGVTIKTYPIDEHDALMRYVDTDITTSQKYYKEFMNRMFGTECFLNKKMNVNLFAIKNVIFNNPATIVFWADGTKTVVKCENEQYDPEKGLAMAISKKALGNIGHYYETFRKWLPEEEKK